MDARPNKRTRRVIRVDSDEEEQVEEAEEPTPVAAADNEAVDDGSTTPLETLPDALLALTLSLTALRAMLMARCASKRLRTMVDDAVELRRAIHRRNMDMQAWGAGGARRELELSISPITDTPLLSGAWGGYNLLRLSPDGSRLVHVSARLSMRRLTVYQMPDFRVVGNLNKSMEHETNVVSVAAGSKLLASADQGGTIIVWDAASLKKVGELQHGDSSVYGLAFHGDLLVSGSKRGSVALWDACQRVRITTIQSHTSWVYSVDVAEAPDGGRILASGGRDEVAVLWKLDADGHAAINPAHRLQHPGSVFAVHLAREMLITGGGDRVVRTFCLATGQCTRVLRGHVGSVFAVALSGTLLVSGGEDKTVKLWDLERAEGAGACVGTLVHSNAPRGIEAPVRGVAVTPVDGGLVASLGTKELVVWSPWPAP